MSDDRFTYAFSHMLVAGTTIWCIFNTPKGGQWPWIYGTYIPLSIYSIVGIWRYGNPRYGDDAYKCYDYADKSVMAFALPYYLSEFLFRYGFDWQYSYFTAALPIFPCGIKILDGRWNQELVDLIVMGCAGVGCAISCMEENYFGVIATLNYFISHFVLRNREIADVPTKVFYNIGLCFFVFYAYKALRDSSVFHDSVVHI